jgi:hypothetical protein
MLNAIPSRTLRTATKIAVLATVGCLAFACIGGDDGDPPQAGGPSRSFMIGFSSLPRELNAESYAASIDFAGEFGELVLIQRSVPWEEFLPGRTISDATAENTTSERDAAKDAGLRIFFGIDPTDGATGRDRLGGLPEAMAGRRFDDPDVRSAFRSYAEYVALNYKPDFMALGVEMNLYYQKNVEDWENFLTLYAEAYEAVKRASPKTQVTVTLQYEDLQGLLPREDAHFPEWQLVRAFDPIDFVAISTYPSFAFDDPAAIPPKYYSQLRAFTDKPIAISEMGYASGGASGSTPGTEEEQSAFVVRALDEAERRSMLFAVWFAIWDPAYARDTEFGAFETIGLIRSDDTKKPSWQPWLETSQRPYRAREGTTR